MIRNWGIRSRVLLLALVPVVCLGFVLGTYLTRVRLHDLHISEHALGDTLANQLASASEYGVFSNNVRILQTLAQAVAREPGVESISIIDRNGHTLTHVINSSQQSHALISDASRRIGTETGFGSTLTFSRPIVLQSFSTSNPNDFLKNGNKTRNSVTEQFQVIGKVTVTLSEAHFAERQTQIIVNGGIIMLSFLTLSILLALVIGGSVAVPITRIIEMVKRFSSGDHATRVPEHSGGEIGQLESGINLMAAHAERSQQELQLQVNQATAELRETMDEMEIKNVELDLARKRALEASQVKSEFLSNMSHEIRTPMNAIVGFSRLLAKTRLNKDQRDYLDTVQHSAAILLTLIDDVLGLQSLEAGKPLQQAAFNLQELMEEAIKLLAPEAYRKELELILDLPVDVPVSFMGDAVKISRVLINLLSNAVKFTEQGQVKLSTQSLTQSTHAVTLSISVQDTGIGIRKDHIKELFKPFTMLNTTTSKHTTGTGLGLAISRQLMDALGGSLSVSSHPDEGSEFRMELALDLLPSSSRLLPISSRDRVLLYESQTDMAAAMQSRLEGLGYFVMTCHNLSNLSTQLHSETVT
ncbi:MAG TPA: ATP-binding protein, partial [Gammaproteobacteria bacterium]|nr:ATP-binding protein [Gammaproteobacteria bacterium]